MRDLCCLQMPRKKKSVRVVSSPIKPIKAPNRPAKLRNWKDEAMTGAIEAVKEGMGVNCAAKEFGVPATTLRNRLSGRVTHGTNPGPKPYLSSQEEDELAAYLTSTSKAGYGKTRRQVMNIATPISSVVSKYLVKPVSTPKSRGTIVRTGARVLTSAESMRLLEEKEALKRRQAEEKEQRKLEREEKKKKKEEEKKQKAEARVSKAAERLAKQGQKGRRGPKRKAPAITRNDDTVNNDNAENEDSDEHSSGAQPVRKKTRGVNERVCEKSTIDTNLCCVCYIYYQEDVAEANGRNWIACSCGRWLHKDCALIEPEMIATSEEFCPECVM